MTYFYALTASLLFSGSTVVFSRFSFQLTSHWVVAFKNWVGFFGFLLAFLFAHASEFTASSFTLPDFTSVLYLFCSGFLGLLVGDLFLFKAISTIGSSRTLMVFNLQPILLTLAGTFMFHQVFYPAHAGGLILMMACLVVISLERFHSEGHWDLSGVLAGVVGVLLDAVGILLTRAGFDRDPSISPMDGNLYRFMGGIAAFLIFRYWIPFDLKHGFLKLKISDRFLIIGASFAGTFLSLALWLTALRQGHLASLSGIPAFAPVGAALWEWVILRRLPTPYWWTAFVLFLLGFAWVIRAGS